MGCHFFDRIVRDCNFHLSSRFSLSDFDEVSGHVGEVHEARN